MCWLVDQHPLVQYARQSSAGIVHLFNFVNATKGHGERADWVNHALFAELLSRVEGDALESSMRAAVERGLMRPEAHGSKAGFVIDRTQPEVRVLLGEFSGLNGVSHDEERPALPAGETPPALEPSEAPAIPPATNAAVAAPRKRTRRGSRGGRNRRGGRGRKTTTSSPGGEAAD